MKVPQPLTFADLLPLFESYLRDIIHAEIKKEMEVIKPLPKKKYYNIKELAEITGITYLGIKGQIKRGTLIASKVSNTWLVHKNEVDSWIQKLESQRVRKIAIQNKKRA